MATLCPYPLFKAFDSSDVSLTGGKVNFYEPGLGVRKDTYTTPAGTTENTNPVILDSRGEADIYLNGSYKVVLTDSDDNVIWTKDPVSGISTEYQQNAYYVDDTVADQGAATTEGNRSIKDFVDDIGSTSIGSIICRRGTSGNSTTYTLTTSETIPDNIMFIMEPGAIISDGGGAANLVIGKMDPVTYKVFDWTGSGAPTFSDGAIPYVYPEMFGGASDGDYTAGTGTDNTTPFAQAIASGAKKIMLLVGEYKGNIILDSDLILEGIGQGDTILFPATDDAVIKTLLTDNTVRVVFKNFRIDGTFAKATFTTSDGIRLGATTADKFVDTIRFENVRIDDMGRYGLYCFGDTNNFVQDLYADQLKIYDCTKAGLYVSGHVLEFLFNASWFARNGDASNPSVEFVLDTKRANRINFTSCRFNHADYSTTGTAAKFQAVDQLSFKNCDFEEADIMLHVLHSLSRGLGVKECNFASTGNVTKAIYLQDINGAEIGTSVFASTGTMTTGILGDSAINRLRNIKIDATNVYSNVTTPVDITNNTTIDTGKIYAYQDYMRVNTEASAATDNLDYIYDSSGSDVVTGLQHGQEVTIRPFNTARSVVITNDGNIVTATGYSVSLDTDESTFTCKWDNTLSKWVQVSGFTGYEESITADGGTLAAYGTSVLDSTSNKVDSTLPSATVIGTMKVIVMSESSNSSTVSITNHETSDPEVATFNAVDETWIGMWTGTEWVTVYATCTFL